MSLPHSNTGVIDSLVDIPIEKDEAVEKAVMFYETSTNKRRSSNDVWHPRILPLLSPVQIDQVVQRFITEMPLGQLPSFVSSLYITRLIQKSFDSGYNNFMIHTQNVPFESLGYSLKGYVASDRLLADPQDVPLNLTIYGDIGSNTLSKSSGVELVMYGTLGVEYLHNARSCLATIFGTPKDISTEFKYVTLRMTDETIFKRYKEETSKKYPWVVPLLELGNEFFLIDDKGKELEAFRQ